MYEKVHYYNLIGLHRSVDTCAYACTIEDLNKSHLVSNQLGHAWSKITKIIYTQEFRSTFITHNLYPAAKHAWLRPCVYRPILMMYSYKFLSLQLLLQCIRGLLIRTCMFGCMRDHVVRSFVERLSSFRFYRVYRGQAELL